MSSLDGALIDETTAGINAPAGIQDAGKLARVDAEGTNLEYVDASVVIGDLPPPEGGTVLPDGEHFGQPLVWNGATWEPLIDGAGLVTDRLSSLADLSVDAVGVVLNIASFEVQAPAIGFFEATAVARPSITGATAQDQIDSLIAALAALGLVSDDR